MGSMRRRISVEERRARLARRHRLLPSRRTDDLVALTDDLVGLHSSDPTTVYLSLAARMARPSIAAVSDALYRDRSLLRHHAMRRTLWVFSPEGARIAHAAATRRLVGPEQRRLVRLLEERGGVEQGEAWLAEAATRVVDAIEARGRVSTRELREALPDLQLPLDMAPGKSYSATVSALSRILPLLGFQGRIGRLEPSGGWTSSQYAWTPLTAWFPDGIDGLDPRAAAAELCRRWLLAFGPAPASDLQWWAGWPAGLTRKALSDAAAVEVELDGAPAWVHPDDVDAVEDGEPWLALLPGLDPTTMGWKARDWYLDPRQARLLFDGNGNGGPCIWSNGRIVGGWAQRSDGEIAWRVLEDIGAEAERALELAAIRLQALLGESRVRVRFPAPIQKALLA